VGFLSSSLCPVQPCHPTLLIGVLNFPPFFPSGPVLRSLIFWPLRLILIFFPLSWELSAGKSFFAFLCSPFGPPTGFMIRVLKHFSLSRPTYSFPIVFACRLFRPRRCVESRCAFWPPFWRPSFSELFLWILFVLFIDVRKSDQGFHVPSRSPFSHPGLTSLSSLPFILGPTGRHFCTFTKFFYFFLRANRPPFSLPWPLKNFFFFFSPVLFKVPSSIPSFPRLPRFRGFCPFPSFF